MSDFAIPGSERTMHRDAWILQSVEGMKRRNAQDFSFSSLRACSYKENQTWRRKEIDDLSVSHWLASAPKLFTGTKQPLTDPGVSATGK